MVDISKLRESELPAEPSEFETLVRKHCGDAREAFQLRYGNSSMSTHPMLYMLIVSGGCKSVGTYSVHTNHLGAIWCQQILTKVLYLWSTSLTVPAA